MQVLGGILCRPYGLLEIHSILIAYFAIITVSKPCEIHPIPTENYRSREQNRMKKYPEQGHQACAQSSTR